VRPTAGVVRVLDADPEDPRTRARIGYLPERLHLPQAQTPTAFLGSVARLKALPGREQEIRRQLLRVGLAADAERRIGGFSKGMKQRLGLAAALLGGPELLVLDEPTDGVDPLGRAEIRRILAEERARGATVFLNSHLLSETERVCDRIGILAHGLLIRSGALDELTGDPDRYRVRFAPGADPTALAAAGFEPSGSPDAYRVHAADPVALDAALARARAAGALLVELGSDLRDLEEVLADAVQSAGRKAGAA
jgi:ABC-2 type transport system ATP-binding protein